MAGFRDHLTPEESPKDRAQEIAAADREVQAEPTAQVRAPRFAALPEESFVSEDVEDASIAEFRGSEDKENFASRQFLNRHRQRKIAAAVVTGVVLLLVVLLSSSNSPTDDSPTGTVPVGGITATGQTGASGPSTSVQDDKDFGSKSSGVGKSGDSSSGQKKDDESNDALDRYRAMTPTTAEKTRAQKLLDDTEYVVRAYDKKNAIPNDSAVFNRLLEKYGDLGVKNVINTGRPEIGEVYVNASPFTGIAILQAPTADGKPPMFRTIKITKRSIR